LASLKKIHANRINARASTGPRTALGMIRASSNAKRHGLSASVLADPSFTSELLCLGRLVAGRAAGAELLEYACHIAAAQVDLVRVREVRHRLYAQSVINERGLDPTATARRAGQLLALDRYERRALSRRKRATDKFDSARQLAHSC
jgi:hypothetical protein